jgi:hypothetical protein
MRAVDHRDTGNFGFGDEAFFALPMDDGYGAESGASQGNPRRRTSRPAVSSTDAAGNVRFAQISLIKSAIDCRQRRVVIH